MEKSFIENALKTMDFKIRDTDKNLIKFVNMCKYGVANEEKPLLLTVGLQSCVALIAYEKNFSFLAHINLYNYQEKDFEVNKRKEVTRCKKVNDLYNEISKVKDKINGTINIGLVLGVTPEKEHENRKIIENDLLKMFEKLRKYNISARRLPDMNSFSFILDSRIGSIIHDGVENQNRITQNIQEKDQIIKDDKRNGLMEDYIL